MKYARLLVLTGMIVAILAACGPAAGPTAGPGVQPTQGSATAAVEISGFAFNPATLTVKVGTTVTWTNKDSAAHTVASDAGDWISPSIAQGESFSRTFDTAGTFAYHCSVHPSMKATVVVNP